jgi:hypothetical protein
MNKVTATPVIPTMTNLPTPGIANMSGKYSIHFTFHFVIGNLYDFSRISHINIFVVLFLIKKRQYLVK